MMTVIELVALGSLIAGVVFVWIDGDSCGRNLKAFILMIPDILKGGQIGQWLKDLLPLRKKNLLKSIFMNFYKKPPLRADFFYGFQA